MKLYIILILTAVGMAFGTGYFALFMQGSITATKEDISKINRMKQEFRRSRVSIDIHFNSIFYSPSKLQLLDPFYSMSKGRSDKENYSSKEGCFQRVGRLLNRFGFEKNWIWEEFRCGERKYLSSSFFEQIPYMHPSGNSFAYLAFKSGRYPFINRNWLNEHLNFFHVTELRKIAKAAGGLGGMYYILSQLEVRELSSIIKGSSDIFSKKYYLAKFSERDNLTQLLYGVYKRKDFDNFLAENEIYEVRKYQDGKKCFYRDNDLCWSYSNKHIFTLISEGTLIFFLGLLVIIIFVIRILIIKLKNQKFEDEKRRLALQVLTHEFRTPVTSLLLIMENLGRKIEDLPMEYQDEILKASSEVYRLQRLTEMSRNYLRAENNQEQLISLKYEEIPSLNEFMEDLLAPHFDGSDGKVTFIPLAQDSSFFLDPYWVSICVKNLVENAKNHGAFPIRVELHYNKKSLVIIVADSGDCQFTNFNELTAEFVKGNKSFGSGLGLSIVNKVVREMKGALKFEKDPTRFSIELPQK